MSGSYLNYIIEEFLVESYTGENVYDMTRCVSSVEYFEDLFSPAIFLRLVLANTSGELSTFSKTKDKKGTKSKYGLRGGERVRLKIKQLATNEYISLTEDKRSYYIYKISASSIEHTRETLVVEIAPIELFNDETIRVTKKYPDQTIDKSVADILKNVLKTNKNKNIESVQNKYSFYGNNKRPFTVLSWLAPKSIPLISGSSPQSGTAGFLFYESKDGYNFKSMDTLLRGLIDGSAAPTYTYSAKDSPATEAQNFTIVNLPTFEKNVNIWNNMRMGMYSSINTFFDLNTKSSETYVYKLSESYNIMNHTSSKNDIPQIPTGLENSPSRVMVKLIDSIVTDPKSNADPLSKGDLRIKYQSQSIARYNLAFSQLLNITIPLNLSLTVGDIINLNFGLITQDISEQGLTDKIKSGPYLIMELIHNFNSINGYTILKVTRDSYGV